MSNGFNDFLNSRLREVFEVCDVEKRGYISVDHFVELARDFANSNGRSDKKFIDRMVSVLDSEGNGRISFQEFCKGVKEILQSNHSLQGNNDMNNTVINDFLGRRLSVEDPKPLTLEIFETDGPPDLMMFDDFNQQINHLTPNPISNNHDRAVQSTTSSLEEDGDSGSWSTSAQEINWPPKDNLQAPNNSGEQSLNKSRHRHTESVGSNINSNNNNNNNNYEYDDDDCDDEKGGAYFVRKSTSTPVSTPRSSIRSASRLSAPASRSGSFRKSVTPSSVASQLYRSNLNNNNNCSDFYQESSDFQVVELSEKVTKLEDQLISLSETQKKSEDKQLKMKEENVQLVERKVHILEEQLRDMEQMNEERFKEEEKKHKDLLMKTEKDKSNQIEILTQSLKLIESEYSQLKSDAPTLKSENEQLKRQNFGLEREMSKLRQECSEVNDDKLNLQETLQNEQTKINKERLTHSQLLDELTQELNELRQYKTDLIRLSPSQTRDVELPRSLKVELETQISRLKQDNANLKYQVEELQALMLNKHIEEGQALVQSQVASLTTLAAELDEVPRNELMLALHKEQESNRKLREYIENMTLRILESNPNILEIHSKKNGESKK